MACAGRCLNFGMRVVVTGSFQSRARRSSSRGDSGTYDLGICQRGGAWLDRQHRPQHARGDRRLAGARCGACALSAHSNLDLLVRQAQARAARAGSWPPTRSRRRRTDWSDLPSDVELLVGPEAWRRSASEAEVDIVVAAIVGSAGLRGTWAAVEAGKTVALANKETMVVAGPLVTELAHQTGRPDRTGR